MRTSGPSEHSGGGHQQQTSRLFLQQLRDLYQTSLGAYDALQGDGTSAAQRQSSDTRATPYQGFRRSAAAMAPLSRLPLQTQQPHAPQHAPAPQRQQHLAQDDPCEADMPPASPGDSDADLADMPELMDASPDDPMLAASVWGPNPFGLAHYRGVLRAGQQRGGRTRDEGDGNGTGSDSEPPLIDLNEGEGLEEYEADDGARVWYADDHADGNAAGAAVAAAAAGASGQQEAGAGASRPGLGGSRSRARGTWRNMPPPNMELQLTDLFTPFGRPLAPSLLLTRGPRGRRSARAPPAAPAAAAARAPPAAPAASAARAPPAAPAAAPAAVQGGSGTLAGQRRVWRRTGRVALRGPPPVDGSGSFDDDDDEAAAEHQHHEQHQHQQGPPPAPLRPQDCRPPAPCSFLQPGVSFVGVQKLLQAGLSVQESQWSVRVVLHEVDRASGHVSGSMQAFGVAGADGPIDTYFEGCIVDEVHHTFWTGDWGASHSTDLRHWSKFEGFQELRPLVVQNGGRCGRLDRQPLIFMRWKEQFFVNNAGQADCGLTIAGFYYAGLCRSTGRIRGFYYDPHSSPFQELDMRVEATPFSSSSSSSGPGTGCGPSNGGSTTSSSAGGSSTGGGSSSACGMTFASYDFA